MESKDKVFLDTNVALDFLADRQPFAESAHRLFALAEMDRLTLCVSSLTFSHLYYLLRKWRGHTAALELLVALGRLVRISPVGAAEVQAALGSSFKDFEDALQYFAAQAEGGVTAIVTRDHDHYSASKIEVFQPEEYLANRGIG